MSLSIGTAPVNRWLSRIMCDLSWNVLPYCAVFIASFNGEEPPMSTAGFCWISLKIIYSWQALSSYSLSIQLLWVKQALQWRSSMDTTFLAIKRVLRYQNIICFHIAVSSICIKGDDKLHKVHMQLWNSGQIKRTFNIIFDKPLMHSLHRNRCYPCNATLFESAN